MCTQECALYGDLVRYLRDRCIEHIAELDLPSGKDASKAWVDKVIRDWFFVTQENLHGDAPRDVIWREQKGEPNSVSKDHEHEMFFDDCPVCQAMKDLDQEGDWQWCYDDGGYPLIAEYDPDGWDARWVKDNAIFKKGAEQKDTCEPSDDEIGSDFSIDDMPDFSTN